MADVITRFKLETTQYDSKLRDSVKGLKEVVKMAELAGKDFKGFEKSTLEAARSLGKIETGANNSKDKVRELVGAFNDMANTYNAMSKDMQQNDVGKALAESMKQLQSRIKEAKQELYGLGNATEKSGGGLFGGLGGKMSGALQVFAGNVMTKASGAVVNLGSEMVGMVKQGVELARQGEGIRIAFERLGRGDILDGLREATHGTVTDLELMKAAVKFNDFKLPVEELGTMLAFAQQKAKDTGQSVDYMVDSIVTGLGRKSLMILDNLGLSATEVKEKMKETGDMTKAVGEIIRDQMSKAGDYVETAADRAEQANVSLQNKMEELGRKFGPLEQASNNFWTSIKIGILDIVGGPLTDFLNKLTEAGRLANQYGLLGGNAKVGRMTSNLAGASAKNRTGIYQRQQEQFWRYINRRENYMKDRQRWIENPGDEGLRQHLLSEQKAFGTNNVGDIQDQIRAARKMLADYQQSARSILNPAASVTTPAVGGSGGSGGKGNGPSASDFEKFIGKSILGADSLKGSDVPETMSLWASLSDETKKSFLGLGEATVDLGDSLAKLGDKAVKDEITGKINDMNKALQQQQMALNMAGQAASNFGAALAGIDDPAAKAAGTVISAIANIALGFANSVAMAGKMGPWAWLAYVAAGTAALATTIQTVHSLTGYAEGGMVKGNSYSGDNIGGIVDGSQLVGLNAGEIVLNKAQQANVASGLQGNGLGGMSLKTKVKGTELLVWLDNSLAKSGRGELVTWGQ